MKTKVLNLDNKSAGEVELNDSIFGLEPRQDLIQRVVVWQLAKRRGRNKARVALARKVLTLVYYGLRDGEIRCLVQADAA